MSNARLTIPVVAFVLSALAGCFACGPTAAQPVASEAQSKQTPSAIGAHEALRVAIEWIRKEKAASIERYKLTYKYEVVHEGANWRISFAPIAPEGKIIRGGDGDILVDAQTGKIVDVVLGQ